MLSLAGSLNGVNSTADKFWTCIVIAYVTDVI